MPTLALWTLSGGHSFPEVLMYQFEIIVYEFFIAIRQNFLARIDLGFGIFSDWLPEATEYGLLLFAHLGFSIICFCNSMI